MAANKKGTATIALITARAKKIRKEFPKKEWKNCVKEASAQLRKEGKIGKDKKKTAKK